MEDKNDLVFDPDAVRSLLEMHKVAGLIQKLVVIDTTPGIKNKVWDIWHASKGAVPYSKSGHVHARMQYTAKHLNKEFPEFSRMVFYKYLDRNIN